MEFTVEEVNFICLIKGEDRDDTINNIFEMMPDIDDDDIKRVAETVIGKLDVMTDAEFNQTQFDEATEE